MNMAALPPEQLGLVEAIAERVVELLSSPKPVVASRRLLNAAELAGELGVARSFVYEHAEELGAVRLGNGPKPRLRFDLEQAGAALACSVSKRSQPQIISADGTSNAPRQPTARRMPSHLPRAGSVLTVRGRKAAA